MSGMRSRRRGASYERRVAKLLNDALGTQLCRTPASGGLGIKGDLRDRDGPFITGLLAGWVIECKNQEHLNVWACIHQAQQEAGSKKWLLAFSRNREGDYVCMDINDFIELLLRAKQNETETHVDD